MGFSDIASQIIMFLAVLIIATLLVIFFNNYSKETLDSANIQRQRLSDRLKTDINIDIVNYDNSTNPNTIYIYIKNTGRTLIDSDSLDVYVDKARIPRNSTNRTINIISDTDTINPGKWDPKEELLIKVFENLTKDITHTIDIILDNGVSDTMEFST